MLVAFKTLVREAVRRLRAAHAAPPPLRHRRHPRPKRQTPRPARRYTDHLRLSAAGRTQRPAEPGRPTNRIGDHHDHHPH